MAALSACNPNQSVSVITTVIKNLACADRAVTTIHQFRLHSSILVKYILSFFSKEKEIASLNLRAHTYCDTSSFHVLVHPTALAVFLCTILPPFQLSILTPEGFRSAPHRCSWPERCLFSVCSGRSDRERLFTYGGDSFTANWWHFFHHNILLKNKIFNNNDWLFRIIKKL